MKTLALLLLIFTAVNAHADQWLPATPATYSSRNGTYRLTIFPRQLAGALPYFEDKVAGKSSAGQMSTGQLRCEATLDKLVGRKYEQLWRRPLVNDVSPVSALVSDDDGSFVTFDNWHSMGEGDDTIVLYNSGGKLIKKLALTDIMSKTEFENLPRSVSSIWWGGEHELDYDEKVVNVRVVIGSRVLDSSDRKYRTIRLRLDTGAIVK